MSLEVLISDGAKKNSERKLILLILDDHVSRKLEIVTISHKFSHAMRALHLFALSSDCFTGRSVKFVIFAKVVKAITYFGVELNSTYTSPQCDCSNQPFGKELTNHVT